MVPGSAARAVMKEGRRVRASAETALEASSKRSKQARKAFQSVCDEIVQHQLESIPIARLRETTGGRLRLGPIEAAGYNTVAAAAAAGRARLQGIRGVGPQTATQVVAAARQLEAALKEGVRPRFDPDRRPEPQTKLLAALHSYDVAESSLKPIRPELTEFCASIEQLRKAARRTSNRLRMRLSRRRKREEALEALSQLGELLRNADMVRKLQDIVESLESAPPTVKRLWRDYEQRVATYNGLLIDVAGLAPEREALQGFVPSKIAERVHAQALDTSNLKVSLRGYQAFGAKFALVQEKAILGDEMGLGKTVEALAAMGHLQNEGGTHFLVVCPASVLVNWAHETERHTHLHAIRLHGPDRETNLNLWARRGGIGVTTFESLRALRKPAEVTLSLLVVDEAHYVKNPRAQRTVAVNLWIKDAERTLFLTGTPMENRVDEFRTLVHHLQPKVATQVRGVDGLAGATRFRAVVAPVYLRRNQLDVLEELPPRIEVEDWVALEGADLSAYRDAVASGNFMSMRQAAYAPADTRGSAKLERLVEIVEEAAFAERKIVVFSFFRAVLNTVADALGQLVVGQLTGSVPPAKRQKLVDDFSARSGAAVLVSQIQAGGVGLNIQAASVVILTEPQWKPTTEDQAIARCHRMGQVRTVNVHRLLAEDSVDQRMLEILARKSLLFDEYVRRSDLKDSSADAVDISDLDATREAVSQAEAERRIVEAERRRLGIPTEEPDASTVS
jgi:SNF2 family DNA or RNA helicase